MPPITISSREFNQDVGRAKRAARSGPVVITDRGRPAHVLLSFEEYRASDEYEAVAWRGLGGGWACGL